MLLICLETGTQTSEVKGDNNGHSMNVIMLSVKPGKNSALYIVIIIF